MVGKKWNTTFVLGAETAVGIMPLHIHTGVIGLKQNEQGAFQ